MIVATTTAFRHCLRFRASAVGDRARIFVSHPIDAEPQFGCGTAGGAIDLADPTDRFDGGVKCSGKPVTPSSIRFRHRPACSERHGRATEPAPPPTGERIETNQVE
jgi:hypothetical protein